MVTDEIWKPIKGYEGRYEVSNTGKVKSLERIEFMPWMGKNRVCKEKPMRIQQKDNIYLFVTLSDGGGRTTQKCRYVHRLVAEAFKGPIPKGHIINHKDRDRTNNHEDNIEIVSQRDNCLHCVRGRKKSSKYPGVHFEVASGWWKAMARRGKKKVYLGKFDNEDSAYEAYKAFVSNIDGELKYLVC